MACLNPSSAVILAFGLNFFILATCGYNDQRPDSGGYWATVPIKKQRSAHRRAAPPTLDANEDAMAYLMAARKDLQDGKASGRLALDLNSGDFVVEEKSQKNETGTSTKLDVKQYRKKRDPEPEPDQKQGRLSLDLNSADFAVEEKSQKNETGTSNKIDVKQYRKKREPEPEPEAAQQGRTGARIEQEAKNYTSVVDKNKNGTEKTMNLVLTRRKREPSKDIVLMGRSGTKIEQEEKQHQSITDKNKSGKEKTMNLVLSRKRRTPLPQAVLKGRAGVKIEQEEKKHQQITDKNRNGTEKTMNLVLSRRRRHVDALGQLLVSLDELREDMEADIHNGDLAYLDA